MKTNGAKLAVQVATTRVRVSNPIDTPAQAAAGTPGRLDYHRERLGGLINQLEHNNDTLREQCARLGIGVDMPESLESVASPPNGILEEIDQRISRLGDSLDRYNALVRALEYLG